MTTFPHPGYSWGRALCICRSTRRVQPESKGDLWHGGLSTRRRCKNTWWQFSIIIQSWWKVRKKTQEQSPGLSFAHIFSVKSLAHLNQLVPSRRMAFLSPTQNWNTKEPPNLIALNKRLFVPLIYWKMVIFQLRLFSFLPSFLYCSLCCQSKEVISGSITLYTVRCTWFSLHLFTLSNNWYS
jgi:hypothetical protein